MLPSTRKLHLKVVANTKKFRGGGRADISGSGDGAVVLKYLGGGRGALADQEMGPWWSINSSIMSPEINFKCSQKQPKTKLFLLASYSQSYGHKDTTVKTHPTPADRPFCKPLVRNSGYGPANSACTCKRCKIFR